MHNKFTWMDGLVLVVWLLPLLYLVSVYPTLGPTLPLHFNAAGQADSYGSKAKFLGVILFMSGVGLGTGLLMRFLPRIDPKKKAKYSEVIFIRIGYAVVLFVAVLTGLVIYACTKGNFKFQIRFMYPLVGLLLAYLGNLMNSVKPNYFVGIRTPWTLENEEVWRKTHQLAARIWLPGGVLLMVLAFILRGEAMFIAYISILVVLSGVPIVYSYLYYRKLSK